MGSSLFASQQPFERLPAHATDALVDQKLLERGKQRHTRAQVLAEAMAGADFGLKFSTSLKRISETRIRDLRHSCD